MVTCIFVICFVLAFCAYLAQAKRDLMMLQQNSYRNNRFRTWMKQSGESTRVPRLFAFIVASVALLRGVNPLISSILVGVFSLVALIMLIKAKYKKPLVFTARAKRIYFTDILLVLVLFFLPFTVSSIGNFDNVLRILTVELALAFAVSYLLIQLATWLLQPVEAHINDKYYKDAASRLASMHSLKIIGITGSYGKTSTKFYLNRILSEQYEVAMTPGNFNTTLGVVRTIRENLKPYDEVFIVEMGAKEIGDIKEICDLVHPQIGIVTAVGPQHLESFKTIENVQRTKFELVDSLPADGLAVLNNDFDYIANREVGNTHAMRYAVASDRIADYHASDIQYSPAGTVFTINDANGPVITLKTSLVGRCNISNLMGAVAVALRLGVPKDKIQYAVEKIQQVEHRLSIKRNGPLTIIDDAYNSNPMGSEMALEVMSGMTGGKRIIITPGMIELGDSQYQLNKEFGSKIPGAADIAIVVGEYNREAILEGIKQGEMDMANVYPVASFAEAQQLLSRLVAPGDTILYENDLPDTFK